MTLGRWRPREIGARGRGFKSHRPHQNRFLDLNRPPQDLRGTVWIMKSGCPFRFRHVLGLFEDLTCSHRLRGLPSSGSPFIASHESPCASETYCLFSAGNGRTSTDPSRQERGSLAHCKAGILRWPTNQISRFTPLTWSESLPSSQREKLIQRTAQLVTGHPSNITVRGNQSYHQQQPTSRVPSFITRRKRPDF